MADSKKPKATKPALIEHWPPELPQNTDLEIGLSGGIDSVVLLHRLTELRAQLGFRLRAVHIDHGIHPDSQTWAQFCESLCAQYNVPFRVGHAKINPANKGLEAAAREARYHFFAQSTAHYLVLAHHADDLAETVLLAALRGGGCRALSAMPILRPFAPTQPHLQIWRPLLHTPKSALLHYAATHDLAYVEDPSNADTRFRRNFLRHHISPQLEKHLPHWREHLAATAQIAADEAALIDEIAELDLTSVQTDRRGLDLARWKALSSPRQRQVLRLFFTHHALGIGNTLLHEIQTRCLISNRAAMLLHHTSEYRLYGYRGQLRLARPPSTPPEATIIRWRGESRLPVPAWKGVLQFSRAKQGEGIAKKYLENGTLTLRARAQGDTLKSRGQQRSLKNLFQEAGIASFLRETWPLLYQGYALIAVPCAGYADHVRAEADEKGWLIEWIPD